ncbi:hypothetical protein PV328_006303 [Microctonus aethiopoides]|uniref:Uncharacterized protein n=1 Tax=Microctonus aethiopoides TaxID=144406 RepID=A0AA39KTD5_9HYME|nr:hypothetical protein PV328_006303 [Microctonus aethiopoides]
MLRRVLERQGAAAEAALSDSQSTPLRSHWSGLNPTRLIDKQMTSEQVPVYASLPIPPNQQEISHKNFQRQFIPLYTLSNSTDRFIPQRKDQNFEVSRYNLMHRDYENDHNSERYFNVLHQIKTLTDTSRKRLMIKAMDELNIVRGIGSQKVLNICSKSTRIQKQLPIYKNNRNKLIEDSSMNDVWKVRARNRPLIGSKNKSIKLQGYRRFPSRGAIDWSSKDVIVAAIEQELYFFTNVDTSTSFKIFGAFPEIGTKRIQCVKWSHNGQYVAISSQNMHLVVLDVETEKAVWQHACICENCFIRCICWSKNDREIITGCSEGRLCLFQMFGTQQDRLIHFVQAHNGIILNIGISPNNRYVVSTGYDKGVRVYLFPELDIFLEIEYFDATEAHAWHPWEAGMLCIGGGLGDGSLSLWDVTRQQCIGYRRIDYLGYVRHLAWNKLTGELVVVWYYWENTETRQITIPVLSSWDRVVDVINFEETERNSSIANIIWNPDHTVIGLQTEAHIHCFNICGNHADAWLKKIDKRKQQLIAKKSVFDLCCIR